MPNRSGFPRGAIIIEHGRGCSPTRLRSSTTSARRLVLTVWTSAAWHMCIMRRPWDSAQEICRVVECPGCWYSNCPLGSGVWTGVHSATQGCRWQTMAALHYGGRDGPRPVDTQELGSEFPDVSTSHPFDDSSREWVDG